MTGPLRQKSLSKELLVRAKLPVKAALLRVRKEDYGPKVFCIGFNKTGTTSVGKAFESFGYRNASFNRDLWLKRLCSSGMRLFPAWGSPNWIGSCAAIWPIWTRWASPIF